MKKEYKLDEIFVYEGLKYIVKKGVSCNDCSFFHNELCDPWVNGKVEIDLINKDVICFASLREDKTDIVFKEVE